MKVSKGTVYKKKDSPYLYINISINKKRYFINTRFTHDKINHVKEVELPLLRAKLINKEIILEKEEVLNKTFRYYSELYLNSKQYLKHGTRVRYENCCERFNLTFGDLIIKEIKTSEIKNYLYNLNVKSLTFRNYLNVFKGIFNEALLDDELSNNPCERIKAPKNIKKDIEPFSLYEVNLILSNSSGWFKNFLATAFYTGARTGELFALKWQNVDFKNKRIYINATRGDYNEGSPKTGKNRYVPMFDTLVLYLKSQKKITGMKEYVFLTERGNNLTSSNLANYNWYPLLKRISVPKRVIYNTRHTFATNMITSGNFTLNQIASWLGHSNLRMLINHYNKFISSEIDNFNSNIDVFCTDKRDDSIKSA